MAWSAPSAISTKPKPRERPVSRSETICTLVTVPCAEKALVRSSSDVEKGKFPTYKFLLMVILSGPTRPRKNRQNTQTSTRKRGSGAFRLDCVFPSNIWGFTIQEEVALRCGNTDLT